jgi:hypothetical protein
LETCIQCGTELEPNAKFCSECGTPVEKNVTTEEYQVTADEIAKKVKELVHEGNVSNLVVKDSNGNAVLSIPVTAGVVGGIVAPVLVLIGALAMVMGKYTIVVVRKKENAPAAVAT